MIVKLRSLLLAIIALAATMVIAAVPGVAPQIALLATTALIMGGAGHPLSIPPDSLGFVTRYRDVGVNQYIIPSGTTPDNVVVVPTPEARLLGFGFDPFFTFRGLFDGPFDKAVAEGVKDLDACIEVSGCVYTQAASTGAPQKGDSFIVYGYSQSSTIATLEKRALMERYPNGGGPDVSFLLTANGNRPNGGILARGPQGLTIPIAGLTFSGPTPTNSGPIDSGKAGGNVYPTIDISRQYDGWSDQPTNPLNPFSEVNALFAMYYIHQNYDEVTLGQGIKQDVVGDTTYYLVPTPILPMLMPLESVPVVGNALADTLDPFFRVLVEAGYDRTISPGTPTNWNVLYFPNPVNLVHNLGEAIPTGLDNGISDLTKDENNRPLGTERPGPYGVGGPPVTLSDQTSPATNQQTTSPDTGNPVLTATTEGTQETEPPQPEKTKPPVLTALNNAATRVQAQGEVRQNPLGIPNGSSVLLDGVPGGSKATGAVNGQTGVGSPLKQVGDAVKDAVDNVLKPKPATSSTP